MIDATKLTPWRLLQVPPSSNQRRKYIRDSANEEAPDKGGFQARELPSESVTNLQDT